MNPYSIPPLLTLLSFLSLAVFTVLRGRWKKVNILFLIICILGAFLYTDILLVFNMTSAGKALLVSRTDHFFIVYLIPVYLHFFHAYLRIRRRKWLVWSAYAYAFLLMCLTPTPLYIESMQMHDFGLFAKTGRLYPLFGVASVFVNVYVLALLFVNIRREKNNSHRNRLKYLLAGFGVMGLLHGFNIFPLHGFPVYPPGNFSFLPLIVFAYGMFKYDLLDTGVLIKKGLVYSLLTAFLTCAYALIIIGAEKIYEGFDVSDSIFFPIFFFFLVAFVVGPLKTGIQALIDRTFYKGKYDYQKTIKHVSREIVSVLDYEEITQLLIKTVSNALKIEFVALFLLKASESAFIKFSTCGRSELIGGTVPVLKGSPLIDFLERHRRSVIGRMTHPSEGPFSATDLKAEMRRLHAEIIVPLIFKNRLKGFLVLGEKLSGDLFSPEDTDLLETLAGQSALALENARSYQKINDLSRSLEKKVEQRTRELETALLEKEKTQELLIRSESLAAIGQLVAGVAHELNNPLTSVTSILQATVEDLEQWGLRSPPDDAWIDDLKFADKELARAASIVTSLLGLSRQTQTYSEPVNLNTVVKDALRILLNQYKHREVELIEKYDPGLPEVHGNFANLGQVVLNIIQNAFQASDGKVSKIFLETCFKQHIRQVVFACTDTGPGVPEQIRQDIFKPFFTTKPVGKGTGLGLYLSHEIIHRHGGTLTLKDSAQSPKGARFEIRLPLPLT